jgi:hypothetical protein
MSSLKGVVVNNRGGRGCELLCSTSRYVDFAIITVLGNPDHRFQAGPSRRPLSLLDPNKGPYPLPFLCAAYPETGVVEVGLTSR